MDRLIKKTVSAMVGLIALTALVSGNQAFAVDCTYSGADGQPFSTQYISSAWSHSGGRYHVEFMQRIEWAEGEFLTDATFYCIGEDWQYQDPMPALPQISINNFSNYIRTVPGSELTMTMHVKEISPNVVLDNGWTSTGVGATCSVYQFSTGPDDCLIKFRPENNNGTARYTPANSSVRVSFSATMTPARIFNYPDSLATYYLVPASGNLIDFVYFIPSGLGYATSNDEYTNPCGDNDDGSNVTVPPLPVVPENSAVPVPQRTIPCTTPPGGIIPQTTVHLFKSLGGPGLAINLSTCEITNHTTSISLGSWDPNSGNRVGEANPLDITLTCTGGLDNIAVVFEDVNYGQPGVTPYTNGITLHGSGSSGQLKNIKAEILRNGTSVVNIRPLGSTSQAAAVNLGDHGEIFIGKLADAPVTSLSISQFSVRLNQTGAILDAGNNAYYGNFEGLIKFTMTYN